MKAVIPAAGIGTRLRPHTLNKPKALLPVAGKTILGHIVDDLSAAGIESFVVIIGYMGDAVREWFAVRRPDLDVTFVHQAERLGLGHAIWTAREALGSEPFFCILGDTILKADYRGLLSAQTSVVAVREVVDPRRFGVVEMNGQIVARFVEKPDHPRSNLAIVGAYFFKESDALWRALDEVIARDIRTKGEYQLTDALQLMVSGGVEFRTVPVTDWFDCGKRESWLKTNRVLLDQAGGQTGRDGVVAPCLFAADVRIEGCRIGPYVSLGPGTVLRNCELMDCVIGNDSLLEDCSLQGSLVGDNCRLSGLRGRINVGDHAEFDIDSE